MPIVYVSHSVAEVKRLASTVVLLRDGRVAGIRTAMPGSGAADPVTA
jgi:ABC-type molybdate transport system ATPase subunit